MKVLPSMSISLPFSASLIFAALTGCASVPESPRPPDVAKVSVPIKAEPKQRDLPERPEFIVDELPLGAPLREQARMCFAEREQRKAYERELEGACR